MTSLLLAGLFFIAVHIGIAGTTLRDRVVAAIGERNYMIVFSIASLGGIVWLVSGYTAAPYVDLWGQPNWWKLVADILMLPAFMLVIIGLATPNPTSVAQGNLATQAPAGIVRVTRHPFLIGVGLWATLHLIANGDLASLLFFGAILVVCIAGPPSIDAKRRRALGATTWDAFARRTSIIPFGAIAAGRNTLDAGQIGWWRIGLGVLAYVLFIGGHRHIIGVSPFPVW